MTTTWRHRDRPPPLVDEELYERRYDNYVRGARYHPAIAAVMAYEDATQPQESDAA